MKGLLEHVDEAYAKSSDGFFAHADLRLAPSDPDGNRILGKFGYGSEHDGDQIVINASPVGGRNAGAFQGWVTLSRAEHRRIVAPRPIGWHSFTLSIGFAPDDESIWWSALYDDDALAVAPFEEMDGGRWLRLPPEFANEALRAQVNMQQQVLGLTAETAPPPGPAVREVILDTIHGGLSILLDDEEMKHLTMEQLRTVKTRLVRAMASADKWYEVRVAQSYSQQKAKSKTK